MRIRGWIVMGLTALLWSCAETDPCVRTNVVCLDRETSDNLVMTGEWEGTYHVGRHVLDTNDLRLSWYGDTYKLQVDRDGTLREPFFDTRSFAGYGTLTPNQREFRAPFAVDEVWHFYGNYYLDDQQIVYKGTIRTHGVTIGTFRLSRNRKCSGILRQKENVCVQDINRASIAPSIDAATIAPNPVTASTLLSISASATPKAEWRWSVTLAPVTAPTAFVGNWSMQTETFQVETTAPSEPGAYTVTITATGNGVTDVKEEMLTVLP